MKTLHDRSRTSHHNTGARPLYFQPCCPRPGWTSSPWLTVLLCAALILALAFAYQTFAP